MDSSPKSVPGSISASICRVTDVIFLVVLAAHDGNAVKKRQATAAAAAVRCFILCFFQSVSSSLDTRSSRLTPTPTLLILSLSVNNVFLTIPPSVKMTVSPPAVPHRIPAIVHSRSRVIHKTRPFSPAKRSAE